MNKCFPKQQITYTQSVIYTSQAVIIIDSTYFDILGWCIALLILVMVSFRLAGSELFVPIHLRRSAVLSMCCQCQQPMRHRMLPAEQDLGHVQFGYTVYVLCDFLLISESLLICHILILWCVDSTIVSYEFKSTALLNVNDLTNNIDNLCSPVFFQSNEDRDVYRCRIKSQDSQQLTISWKTCTESQHFWFKTFNLTSFSYIKFSQSKLL